MLNKWVEIISENSFWFGEIGQVTDENETHITVKLIKTGIHCQFLRNDVSELPDQNGLIAVIHEGLTTLRAMKEFATANKDLTIEFDGGRRVFYIREQSPVAN